MYYRIKLRRIESDSVWMTPGYFRSKKKAEDKAMFWDSFYGKKYDRISTRTWKAMVIPSATRPKHQRRLT